MLLNEKREEYLLFFMRMKVKKEAKLNWKNHT